MTEQTSITFKITATPIVDIERLAQEWRALENLSGNHSFFLSWHWIGTWLRCLPTGLKPMVMHIVTDSQIVGLAILVCSMTPILKIFSLSQIVVNATGNPALDNIAIEYNGFLAAREMQDDIAEAGLNWLLQGGVPNQAVHLAGIDKHLSGIALAAANANRRQARLINGLPAPFVDLASIRNSGGHYLTHLSRNSRQSLRRSLRYYETGGPLEYHTAKSSDEALVLFDELEKAHTIYWQSRGRPGAFAHPHFRQFHTELITAAFSGNHIEMAQISAGGTPIGYLYNFIWRNSVYAYQSGFHYTTDKQARPGYVSHYLAIQSALGQGRNIYDFMAGERQHKSSLSTGEQNLIWLQLRRPTLTVRLEKCVKSLLGAFKNR